MERERDREREKMTERLLSIIVPVYNVEKHIEKCLYSIVSQTYRNIEVVVIDDGSTDKSGLICDEFARNDSRIKVIHTENKGVSAARNMGLNLAEGEYLTFVDSDDYIEPQMYEVLVNDIEVNKVEVAMCNIYRWQDRIKSRKNERIEIYSGIEMLDFLYDSNYALTVVLWNKVYKREIFHDIVFPEGMTREDEFVIHRIIYNAEHIAFRNRGYYHYISRKESITRQKDMGKLYRLQAVENRLDFFREKKMPKLYYLSMLRLLNDSVRCYFYVRRYFDNKEELENIKMRFNKYYSEYENLVKYFEESKVYSPFMRVKYFLIQEFHFQYCKGNENEKK